MQEPVPIHDIIILPLTQVEDEGTLRWVALRDTDHLLARFGQAEVIRVQTGRPVGMRLRSVADEVWALIEGQVEFAWQDLRQGSPTRNHHFSLACLKPTAVLVPSGVAFGFRALGNQPLLLRLSTHADEDPASTGDQDLPWEADS